MGGGREGIEIGVKWRHEGGGGDDVQKEEMLSPLVVPSVRPSLSVSRSAEVLYSVNHFIRKQKRPVPQSASDFGSFVSCNVVLGCPFFPALQVNRSMDHYFYALLLPRPPLHGSSPLCLLFPLLVLPPSPPNSKRTEKVRSSQQRSTS